MRMSFRVFSPNACVGFFCEILDLEEKNVHTFSANAQCSLVEKGCSQGNTVAEVVWIPLWPC